MIRTRLAIAFAVVAMLAVGQALFVWWAASAATYQVERSVVSTRLLAEYLELAGNKQRLKVWFAGRMLADGVDPLVRDHLIGAMRASVADLRRLSARLPDDARALEVAEVETIARSVDIMESALRDADVPRRDLSPSDQWRSVIQAFDEFAGRDMRDLLRTAVVRQERASARESALLAEALNRARVANVVLALIALLLAAVAVAYFVRRLDRPFARIALLTESLAAGDFSARSDLEGNDEFARIGVLIDSMAVRLAQAQARSATLLQQLDDLVGERTRALTQTYESLLGIEGRRRQFFAELSHELRTPVTVIRGEADLALRNPGDAAEQSAALHRIGDAAIELGRRVQDLLDAARSGTLEYAITLQRWSLPEIVAASVAQMQAVAVHRGVALKFDPYPVGEGEICVHADRERLMQALVVVLDNALRYSPVSGTVRVSLSAEPESWLIHVDDEGDGMSDSELDRAFEPHFRGRSGRALDPNGLGIGLSIARRIVEAQRGSIDLQPRNLRGLRASIALPMVGAKLDGAE